MEEEAWMDRVKSDKHLLGLFLLIRSGSTALLVGQGHSISVCACVLLLDSTVYVYSY